MRKLVSTDVQTEGQLYIYITLVNEIGIIVTRWEADPSGINGLYDNDRAAIAIRKLETENLLDTYTDNYNIMTLLLSDSSVEGHALCKLAQINIAAEQIRYRTVTVYVDSRLDNRVVGTLTGMNEGFFGGVTTQLGYQNKLESSCTVDTIFYKYP